MTIVTSHSTILSQKYPSIASMKECTTLLHQMQRKLDHLISQYNLIYPFIFLFISLSPSLQSSQDFSLNTSIPSFNQNILDSTIMPSHFPNPPGPYTPRLYNPLQHQQGIWSYFRLHQYCPLYSGISSNDSTSSISPDDHSSLSSSSLSNTSASFQTRK